MNGREGSAHADIKRIAALAALGVAALAATANALTSMNLIVAALAVVLFAAFVAFTRASFAQPAAVPLSAEGALAAAFAGPQRLGRFEPAPVLASPAPRPSAGPEPQAAPEVSPSAPEPFETAEEPDLEPAAVPGTFAETAEDVPPEPVAPTASPRDEVRVPATLRPEVVAMALLESAAAAGDVVAVHCWLEDPSSATLRQVTAVGSMVPEPYPRPLDDDPLGTAVRRGAAELSAVAGLHVSGASTTLWRFALPVEADEARGVFGIDYTSGGPPDTQKLVEITAILRPSLAGCLALHVARQETATARALVETARELTRRLDPDAVVEHALAQAMELSDAATGSIMLLDDATAQMRIAASVGLTAEIVRDTRVREGEGIAGWVLATRKPVLIEDLPNRRPHRGDVRSAVSVPIADEDGVLGVMSVGSRAYPARFTDSHMEALELLGTQTAAALRNARALTSARELYFATLRALALALETKDPYARGGTERVVRYATLLGDALALDELERQSLEVAALLHDIGMSSAGEAVATSSRPLSTFERGLLKLHPVLAAEILEEVPALRNVIPIVYHHHEWFDGRGYVVGLSGESIPLGARILAVADAYVAMTSDRPYRSAMSAHEALDELEDKAGTQFDPEVVAAFLEMMRRQPEPAPDTSGGE